MVRGLSLEEPQHTPVYFLLQRAWVQAAGNSVAARRALSAIFSLLALALLGLLCQELLGRDAALVACALFAVSPFQLLYAQEAREITLWEAWLLLASQSGSGR